MPERKAFALGCPTSQRRHICLHLGFINEDQPRRINAPLMALPPVATTLHVGTFALVGADGLF